MADEGEPKVGGSLSNEEAKASPADKERLATLLEEYRQLMESQRDNTRIAYSWIGNILMVLFGGLFVFGLTTNDLARFIPAMVLGICLSLVWAGLTEVFAKYIQLRFQRIGEISDELGIPRMPPPGPTEVDPLSWTGERPK